jgi:hypothetical protein
MSKSKRGKKSHYEYEMELMALDVPFVPLEEYINSKTPIKHMCFNEHISYLTPTAVLQNKACDKCKEIDSHQTYIKNLKNKNPELECLEQFKTSKISILHRHITCGYEWRIRPDGILYYGYSCPKCSKHASAKSQAEYLEDLKTKNISYIPVETYINSATSILHECQLGHRWKATPAHILSGKGCPKCNRTGIYSSKYFEKFPEKGSLPGILYLVALVNTDTGIKECLKIGVTRGTSNKSILERSRGFKGYEVRILKMHKASIKEVFELEQRLHTYWRHKKYIPIKKFPGHTECFEVDSDIIKTFPNFPS